MILADCATYEQCMAESARYAHLAEAIAWVAAILGTLAVILQIIGLISRHRGGKR